MWILKWLPNWLFYAVFFTGLIGLVSSYVMVFIPFVKKYKNPLQVLSILAIVFGTYMAGAISNEEAWLARVAELESKVKVSEIESTKQNEKIVSRVVTKVELVKQRGDDIIKYVDREVVKYDNQCSIPKEFIKALNDASEAPK